MGTLSDFVARNGLKMTCTQTEDNPDQEDADQAEGETFWKCTIRRGRQRMMVHVSRDLAAPQPALANVLDALAQSCKACDEAESFEAWATASGRDSNSRRDERTYWAYVKQAKALKRFLGEKLYEELLHDTDRL